MLRLVRCVAVPFALAGLALACSAGTNTHPSPPTSVEYDVEFPSTEAAVGADTVQAYVFSTSTPKTDCASLLVALQGGSDLPTVVAQTDPIALCDMLAGKGGVLSDVGYGTVSFLVVTKRANAYYFTGCTLATLTATSAPVQIQLAQATTAHIPTTVCNGSTDFTVTDFCGGGCTVDGG
jgi:hypothetical protein